jgi:arsenate reductase (thioredoxin)
MIITVIGGVGDGLVTTTDSCDAETGRHSLDKRSNYTAPMTNCHASLLVLSLVLGPPAHGQPADMPANPTLVFVCEHGAAKSVIAAAYFNKMAAERGLRARAIYRGVNPDAELSAAAVKGLRDDGMVPPAENPAAITAADVDRASVIFAIGCTLPPGAVASGKADGWNDVPGDQGYGPMRDAIKKHVERLIDDLLKKQRPPNK